MIKSFFEENKIEYKENISLKTMNTYKIDTQADYIIYPDTVDKIIESLKFLKKNKIKYFFLGNGSNIILSMEQYNGVVIKLDRFNKITYDDEFVTAGSGVPLIKLAYETIEKGLSGLEFATGIPGLVGASTAMNAGAYNSSISLVLYSTTVLTPNYEIKIMKNDELQFKYRDSFLKKNKEYIVLSTVFKLKKADKDEMKKIVEERKQKRMNSQPLDMPNAGSVFRNPDGLYAGGLIEQANLKGYNINGAEVSTKHANFIVNKGNAKGTDIISLIEAIQKEIKKKDNIELKLEQIIVE